jgi:WD40 repeat protein
MAGIGSVSILGRHAAGVTSVRVLGDGRVLSASLDRTLHDWSSGKTVIKFPKVTLYSKKVPTLATTFAAAPEYLACAMHNATVDLYSLAGKLLRKLPNPQEKSSYPNNFHTVAVHPGEPQILAGSNGGYLVVWSAAGEILWRETGFRLINTVRFLRGGKFLLAQEWDPWVHIFDFETKKRVQWETSLMETSANWVTACAAPAGSKVDFVLSTLDADECRLVGANLDRAEPVWDVETESRIHEVCFLPDGRHLLAGGDSGVLELWDTQGGEARRLDLRSHPVTAGAISDDPGPAQGLIRTTPELDDEVYPPWTIHTLDVSADGSFAALGLANGLVLKVALEASL